MKKKLIKLITGIGVFIILCTAVILYQNTFDMAVIPVNIQTSMGNLKGNLVLPKNPINKVGLVVFIHGDGPADASYKEQYKPLWEELAKQGYASLSWSKPGIGGSDGNWLLQSMDDRAEEANEVIEWARNLKEIDNSRIGLWGASQAGWVIPKIVKLNKNIAFNIVVAPAINWMDQGKYNTLKELEKKGAAKDEIRTKEKEFNKELELLEKDASYEEYINAVGQKGAVSKDRWTFIKKNYKADATEDIRYFYSPVKLFLGGKDINVDSENTKRVYEKEISSKLLNVTVIPTTDHFMLKSYLVDSKIRTFFVGLFAPRELADKEYYKEIKEFLK